MGVILNTEELESYNSRLSLSLKNFFLPDKTQISLYVLISSLLLVFVNAGRIWHKFSADYLDRASLGDTINSTVPSVAHFLNSLQGSRVPLIVFWCLAGCSIYILIWFIINIVDNIRNDIIADSYLPGNSPTRKVFWETILFRKIVLVAIAVLLIAYVVVGYRLLLPTLGDLFYTSVTIFKLPISPLEIILAIMVVAFLLHVFTVLLHLASNSWRLVYRNL